MGQCFITRRGLDTSDATATSIDVLKGKTFYANGTKSTGNLTLESNHAYLVEKWQEKYYGKTSYGTDYRLRHLQLYEAMGIHSGSGQFMGYGTPIEVDFSIVNPERVAPYIGKYFIGENNGRNCKCRVEGAYLHSDYYDLSITQWWPELVKVKVVLTTVKNGYNGQVGDEVRTDII